MSRVLTRLGENGRLIIPAEYRRALGVETGDEVILILEEGSVRMLPPREAVKRAQALVRSYIPEGRRLSDELIEERRREARIE